MDADADDHQDREDDDQRRIVQPRGGTHGRDEDAECRQPRTEAPVADDPDAGRDADEEVAERGSGSVGEWDAIERDLRRQEEIDQGDPGESVEHGRGDRAVRMPATDREPRQGDCLRGPGHGNRGSTELGRGRHREQGDARADGEQSEEVALAIAHHEPHADRQVGERGDHEERAPIRLEILIKDREPGPYEERRVGQEERGRRCAQIVAMASELLAAGRHQVEQREESEADHGDAGLRIPAHPGRGLRRGKHERHRRQPAPRTPERHGRRADENDADERQRLQVGRRIEQRRRGKDGDQAE